MKVYEKLYCELRKAYHRPTFISSRCLSLKKTNKLLDTKI